MSANVALESTLHGTTIIVSWQRTPFKSHSLVDENKSAVQVTIYGPGIQVCESVQTLAWLVASLRITNNSGLSLSEVTLHHIKTQGNTDPIQFDLRQCDLKPVVSRFPLCWHKLFCDAVIAYGFPIPLRENGVGLEITPSIMMSLAGILCEATYEDGLVLRGLSTTLVPTKEVESGTAIQWHLFTNETEETEGTEEENPLRSEQMQSLPEWIRRDNIAPLCEKRAFLGWCNPAVVTLGTKRGDYENIDFSRWEKLPKWKRLTGFALGITGSIFGHLSLTASTQVATGKRQRGHFWDVSKDLRGRLSHAQIKPILIYDRKAQRAWLVPLSSTLLHMVHTLAEHHKKLEDPLSTTLPFADEGPNGGKLAWEKMDQHLDDDVGKKSKSEPLKLCDILLRLLIGLDEAMKKTQEIMKKDTYPTSRICSFEFMDIVIGEPPFRFNMHPIEKAAKDWVKIVDAIDLVLCCDGLGNAILPGPGSNTLCGNCKEVPKGHDYLAAVVRCVNSFQGRQGGLPHLTQITDKLYWNPKPDTFRNCINICVRSNLQLLGEKNSTSSDLLNEDLRQCNGAVLFGRATKLTKSRKCPYKAEETSVVEPDQAIPAQGTPVQDLPADPAPVAPLLLEPAAANT